MQQHGASLASISTASENQFILSNTKHQSGSDTHMWVGLSRIQISEGDWGNWPLAVGDLKGHYRHDQQGMESEC